VKFSNLFLDFKQIIHLELVILVNKWELAIKKDPESSQVKELVVKLAEKVKSFGVSFAEDAGNDCAAAVAILVNNTYYIYYTIYAYTIHFININIYPPKLFGNTRASLPGGYAGEELSPDSPISKVIEFPQEFVLLGRATVMIKGIANRLGINWSLSDRFFFFNSIHFK